MSEEPDETDETDDAGGRGAEARPERSVPRTVAGVVCAALAIGLLVWFLVPTDHCGEASDLADHLATMPTDDPGYASMADEAHDHEHECRGVSVP